MLEAGRARLKHLQATSKTVGRCISSEHRLRLLAEIYRREGQHGPLLELLRDPRFSPITEGNSEFDHILTQLWLEEPREGRHPAAAWVIDRFRKAAGEDGQWLRDDGQTWRLLAATFAKSSVQDEGITTAYVTVLKISDMIVKDTDESSYGPVADTHQ